MSETILRRSVQYVVDSDGHKSAVLVDLDVWEQILTLLEDLEDAEEIRRAQEEDEETIPWEQVKADLGLDD
jgi:PHD/YefM family antitoxin component YafN of YafNO toxin-antitoxin module